MSDHCSSPSIVEGKQSNALECLKSIEHSDLGIACREALLIEEKEEAVMNSVDYALLKACKHEIKNYNCVFQGKSKVNGIFRCLKVCSKMASNNREERRIILYYYNDFSFCTSELFYFFVIFRIIDMSPPLIKCALEF